jgi:two-component system, response regulator PdtaR
MLAAHRADSVMMLNVGAHCRYSRNRTKCNFTRYVPMTSNSRIALIVEDEAPVRLVAVEMLIDAGFDVIEAGHAEAALAILGSQAAEISLLFTDITMPGEIDGLKLAHYVRWTWPEIALLITSGETRPLPQELPFGSRFLCKPYTFARVEAEVQALASR